MDTQKGGNGKCGPLPCAAEAWAGCAIGPRWLGRTAIRRKPKCGQAGPAARCHLTEGLCFLRAAGWVLAEPPRPRHAANQGPCVHFNGVTFRRDRPLALRIGDSHACCRDSLESTANDGCIRQQTAPYPCWSCTGPGSVRIQKALHWLSSIGQMVSLPASTVPCTQPLHLNKIPAEGGYMPATRDIPCTSWLGVSSTLP